MIAVILSLVLAVTQADSLPNARPSGYVEPSPSGTVTGRVLDSRCQGPVAYANVLVVGAPWGAMTLEDGKYVIAGVPPGRHQIRTMMLGFMPNEGTVTVVADSTTTCDVLLEPLGVTRTQTKRPQETKPCEEHGIDMQAVSVQVFYGIKVLDRQADIAARDFPNADPCGLDGGSGRAWWQPLVVWGYRCEICVQLRNEWLNGGEWCLKFGETPPEWPTIDIDGDVELRLPPGLEQVATDGDCDKPGDWVGQGIHVSARYDYWPRVAGPKPGDMNGDVIIEDTYVHIALFEEENGIRTLSAYFWAPPRGDRVVRFDVEFETEEMLETACAIVGSVRFVGE